MQPSSIWCTWSEQCVHGGKASACECLCIWHFVTPFNAKDEVKAVQVEAVQFQLLFGVCCPGLAAIQEHADNTDVVHCDLGLYSEL